ncbi:diguanylate cyclase (GGDEF)-like protein [Deinococcus budaensis]|uniref:Diguanylate cyclase (GGDEF)-like protein n=1 Tax=Deinococcus budaensis TaxID=1665626 RepID=A0A7W8GFH4_9DEIO|nr:tetratricopeptide repeat protein [Deinococcus budaensis]MBB5234684.1 diguanylate cyclase (GGDEF)-like protein [Deinococcus budaensis]
MTNSSSSSTKNSEAQALERLRQDSDALNREARALVPDHPQAAWDRAAGILGQVQAPGYTLGVAEALHTQALAALALGDPERGDLLAEQAARAYLQVPHAALYGEALLLRLRCAEQLERFDLALPLCEEVIRLSGHMAMDSVLVQVLDLQAMVQFRQGNFVEAASTLERLAELRLRLGDREGHAKALNNLGLVHEGLGHFMQALDSFLRCLEFLRNHEVSLNSLLSMCLVNVGKVYRELGNLTEAEASLRAGIEVGERTGTFLSMAAGHNELGIVYRERGEYRGALDAFLHALTITRAHGLRHEEAGTLDALGQVQSALGQDDLARATLHEARELARSLDDKPVLASTLIHLGALHAGRGEHEAAAGHLREALTLTAGSMPREALLAREQLAASLRVLGDLEDALVHQEQVIRGQRELFREDSDRRLRHLTDQLELEKARHQSEMYRQLNDVALRAKEDAEAQVRARTEELEQAQLETVTRLGVAAEYRDDRTALHTHRVGNLAGRLAQAFGLPARDVHLIRLAARLHDVGKIGVPDAVLLKQEKFTPEDHAVMRHHTTIGARVLQGGRSELLRLAEQIALTHHERWDGSGYPQGLAGEQIPLVGRIVAVVDVWDALTTQRPYKAAWPPEDALAELQAQAGKHFDPDIVGAFAELLRRGEHETFPEEQPRPAADPGGAPEEAGGEPVLTDAERQAQALIDAMLDQAWDLRSQDPEALRERTQAALTLAQQHGYARGTGFGFRNLAFAHFHMQELSQALDLLGQALEIGERLPDLPLQRDSLNILSWVHASLHSTEKAVACCLKAIELSRKLRDLSGEAKMLGNLALLYKNLEDFGKAAEYFQEALGMHLREGSADGELLCRYNLSDLHLETGQLQAAVDEGRQAVALARQQGNFMLDIVSTSTLARAMDEQGAWEEALKLYTDAWHRVSPVAERYPEVAVWAALYFGRGLLRNGGGQGAQPLLEEARILAERYGIKRAAAEAHRDLAAAYQGAADPVQATEHLKTAYALDLEIYRQENSQRTAALMVEHQAERARAEAEAYRIRTLELAGTNAELEKANREKTALLAALQEQSKRLERQLREDGLTGVYNRRHIEERLLQAFEQHRQTGHPLALLMVDLDHFKQINDRFSHPVGDEVLRRAARLFQDLCRPGNLVGRYGGEEFLVVLPHATPQQAADMAERLRLAVRHHPWSELAPDLEVTLSIGVCARTDVRDHEKMIALADEKLYEAKAAGRDRVAASP